MEAAVLQKLTWPLLSLFPTLSPPRQYLKKLHTQERAVEEVKLAIKPYYQKKDITKEEYKDILRKAVHKVGPEGYRYTEVDGGCDRDRCEHMGRLRMVGQSGR